MSHHHDDRRRSCTDPACHLANHPHCTGRSTTASSRLGRGERRTPIPFATSERSPARTWRDAFRARTCVQAIRYQTPPARLRPLSGESSRYVRLATRGPNAIHVATDAPIAAGPVLVETVLSGTRVRILGHLHGTAHDYTLHAHRIDCTERRQQERLVMPPSTSLPLAKHEFVVRDVSSRGLGVYDPHRQLRLGEGIDVALGRHDTACFRVERGDRGEFGLHLREYSEPWLNAFAAARFPRVKRRSTTTLAALRQLAHTSGYIDLNRVDAFDWNGWADSSAQLPESRDSIVVNKDRHIVAHLSLTAVSPRLTVAHQLMAIGSTRAAVEARTSLYLDGMTWLCANDGGPTFLGASFDPQKRWHACFFEDFAIALAQPNLAAVYRWDRFAVASGWQRHLRSVATSHEFDINAHLDPVKVAELFHAWLPPPALASLRPDPTEWSNGPLAPSRWLVVRERQTQRIVAAALLTRSRLPVSVFGLFDHLRVVPGPGRTSIAPAAMLTVLGEVGREYPEPCTPLVSCPIDTLPQDIHPALLHVEQMGNFVVHRSAFSRFQTFINFRSARLLRAQH